MLDGALAEHVIGPKLFSCLQEREPHAWLCISLDKTEISRLAVAVALRVCKQHGEGAVIGMRSENCVCSNSPTLFVLLENNHRNRTGQTTSIKTEAGSAR